MKKLTQALILLIAVILIALMYGCVSGPPYLTDNQEKMVSDISVYRMESFPEKPYAVIRDLNAADCTGPSRTRLYGQENLAIDYLKRKAVALGADAIIDVACRFAPFVNNCWSANVCTGKAVIWK